MYQRISDSLTRLDKLSVLMKGKNFLYCRLKLEIALVKLSQSVECDQLLFWGRIEGIASNYYLAMSLNFKGQFEFPHKRFYWT